MAIRINRVYTRTGDQGLTGLVGGHRISKADLRIDCYGTVDELNAALGLVRLHTTTPMSIPTPPGVLGLDAILERVQNELFNLGSQLATRQEDLRPTQPVVGDRHVTQLETEIDAYNAELPELRSFVLPGGGPLGAHLHLARTICRRAERLTVALAAEQPLAQVTIHYLNRLSDALFVWARWAAKATGQAEALWQPETP
jgi:cob(I)alamin adenosyltransferase